MTLDIRKYLENLIDKEATVSHFSVKVRAGRADKVKGPVAAQIKSEYGELFLDDADYVLFFTKDEGWSDKDIKKAFELTDRALGKDANKLSKNDFMKLTAGAAKSDGEDAEGAEDAEADDTSSEGDSADSKTLFVKVTIK